MMAPPGYLTLLQILWVLLFCCWSIPTTCAFVTILPFTSHESLSTHLFGIRGFRETFGSTFPTAISEISDTGSCDHLLVDVNQFLHVVMRKGGQTDGHWGKSLVFLMKELDRIVKFTKPTRSIVLAMDGAPPAAKLATQRKRRQTTLDRTENQIQLFERLSKSKSKRKSSKRVKKVLERKKWSWMNDLKTLAITPGTEFMDLAADTILYWAWQRLQFRYGPLSEVQIFFSSSDVFGEGEVKLLEWLYREETDVQPQDRVIMVGGDSDLVLQGLMVPPSLTKQVDVLMPNRGTFIAVQCNEIAESLKRDYLPSGSEQNMKRIRCDIVLLFIMTGNDYLPKLRGGSGFSSYFQSYSSLCRKWKKSGKGHEAYLVDPDTLDFNREFAIEFFQLLANTVKARSGNLDWRPKRDKVGLKALGRLNNLKDTGILPPNTHFEEIFPPTTAECEKNTVTVQLHLGEPQNEEYALYEVTRELEHPRSETLRSARHELAAMLLEEYDILDDPFDADESDDFDTIDENPVEASIEMYLYGLFWNIQKYRDGFCMDYGFNYGRRVAPSAEEIRDFLKQGNAIDMFHEHQTGPISSGLSCVAALPIKVRKYLPPPYCFLSDDTIENVYNSCFNTDDSTFDLRKFAELCSAEVKQYLPDNTTKKEKKKGRLVKPFKTGWTVIQKEYTESPIRWIPPKPFSRLENLRSERCIWVKELPSLKHTHSSRFSSDKIGHQQEGKTIDAVNQKDVINDLASELPVALHLSSDTMKSVEQNKGSKYKLNTTADGIDAVTCLKQLHEAGIVDNVEWLFDDLPLYGETVTLSIASGNSGIAQKYVSARPNSLPRKIAKHQVASIALSDLCGPDWKAQKYNSLGRPTDKMGREDPPLEQTQVLKYQFTVNATVDGVDAVTCLKQLVEAGIVIGLEWNFDALPPHEEIVNLSFCVGSSRNVQSYNKLRATIRPNSCPRKVVKHQLASIALCDLYGPDWKVQNFQSLKHALGAKI